MGETMNRLALLTLILVVLALAVRMILSEHRKRNELDLRRAASRPNLHGPRRRMLLAVGRTITKEKE
jgi:hypothetical protein